MDGVGGWGEGGVGGGCVVGMVGGVHWLLGREEGEEGGGLERRMEEEVVVGF